MREGSVRYVAPVLNPTVHPTALASAPTVASSDMKTCLVRPWKRRCTCAPTFDPESGNGGTSSLVVLSPMASSTKGSSTGHTHHSSMRER